MQKEGVSWDALVLSVSSDFSTCVAVSANPPTQQSAANPAPLPHPVPYGHRQEQNLHLNIRRQLQHVHDLRQPSNSSVDRGRTERLNSKLVQQLALAILDWAKVREQTHPCYDSTKETTRYETGRIQMTSKAGQVG